MPLLKIPFKLIAMPIALVVTVVQWFGIFLTSFAGAIFYIFSGLCFLIALLSYMMGISAGAETVRMLVIGFVSFTPSIHGRMGYRNDRRSERKSLELH